MEEADLDVFVTSRHNVRYFLGAPPFAFFAVDPAWKQTQYLPVVVYVRGGHPTPTMWALRPRMPIGSGRYGSDLSTTGPAGPVTRWSELPSTC